jgi:hypothetical protein
VGEVERKKGNVKCERKTKEGPNPVKAVASHLSKAKRPSANYYCW